MKILAVVITYNGLIWIEKCLSSLINSNAERVDLFIVDNGSTDGTIEYIKKCFSKAIFYESNINLGFGRANNLGLKYAVEHDYDYIYLLNQDAWVQEDTITKLINHHKKNLEYGVLSPLQVNKQVDKLDDHFRHCINNYLEYNILDDILLDEIKKIYSISDVMAAHWLIPIDTVKKVGGFSPSFEHYGEDNNYLDRLFFHDLLCGICPDSIGIHDRETRKINAKKSVFHYYIKGLVSLSNPCLKIKLKSKLKFVLKLIYFIFRLHSFYPMYLLFKLLFSAITIQKNKKISKTEKMAFL